MANSSLLKIADDFWNIRGSFKVGGVIDVGTHASLATLKNGNFALLDACTPSASVKAEIDQLTDRGAAIEAIINLHPFHTVHVERVHAMYPDARLYGTTRHVARFPQLPWQPEHSEDAALHALFANDFAFSVPPGVELVPDNENVHFSSVLAFHRSSRTIHVDDTFMYLSLPRPLAWCGMRDYIGLHPTLAQALEKRSGAAAELRAWVSSLARDWGDARHLCAAHNGVLTEASNQGASIGERIARSLRPAARWTLSRHEKKYG